MRLIWRCLIYLACLNGLLLSGLTAQATPSTSWASECAVVPNCLGVNLAIDFTKQDLEWDLDGIRNAGFKFVRTDMFWQWVEPGKGWHDFRGFDRLVTNATERGLKTLLILDYSNDRLYGPVYEQEGKQAFTAYAKAAASHYKGQPVYWELWNEPNTSHFWAPNPNPGQYMTLANSVVPAMRTANSSAVIFGPAMLRKKPPTDSSVHMTETDYLTGCFKYGYGTLFNGVSYHPYRMEAPGSNPETMLEDYDMMGKLISKLSPTTRLPLLNTERGYNSSDLGSAEKQGDYMVRSYLTGMMSNVPFLIWYSWRDDGPKGGYGIITQSGSPKPAYFKLQKLVTELNGYRFTKRLTAAKNDYVVLFNRGSQYKVAAWTNGISHTVSLYPGKNIQLKTTPGYFAVAMSDISKLK